MPMGRATGAEPAAIVATAVHLAADIRDRYQISSLDPLIKSCRAFAREETLNVAVLGRFKAGKSSFLNHLMGRDLLPVGVIPVTAVVTEISYGPVERAQVRYADGRTEDASVEAIADYIDEGRNPENRKNVALVRVELPLDGLRGIRFVDTPGLESVLAHNTLASREWLPNVGLAIVAVGVDPPLSQQDIELIRELDRYTPNISLLLTKVDALDETARNEVQEYVRTQLRRHWKGSVPVFPYSIRPGYESLREDFENTLMARAVMRGGEHREAILARKVDTLLDECGEYLAVALKSAEAADSERDALKRKILGEKQVLDDSKLALRLIVRHARGGTRALYERALKKRERELDQHSLEEFGKQFPAWARSFNKATREFQNWLEPAITAEIARLSAEHKAEFVEPLHRVGRQLSQSLQDFRNRISERTIETLGVPLRTTEVAFEPEDPKSPDIHIGKIFDREWQFISFLIPMFLFRGVVRNHFRTKIGDTVYKNLQRLATQWEELVNKALSEMEKEAIQRMDDLITTLDHLLSSVGREAPAIGTDLAEVEQARESLAQSSHGLR